MERQLLAKVSRVILLAPIAVALIAFGAACGGKSSSSSSASPAKSGSTPAASAATSAPAVTSAPQVIELHATDTANGFVFQPVTLQVKPGEVTIKYVNDSIRSHDIVIKSKAGDSELVHSKDLNQGESTEVKFTVTDEGSYQFFCDHTGHADRGLRSTMTVSKASS